MQTHYTTTEVARLFGVAPVTMRRWARAGSGVGAVAIETAGGHWRWPVEDVDRELEGSRVARSAAQKQRATEPDTEADSSPVDEPRDI